MGMLADLRSLFGGNRRQQTTIIPINEYSPIQLLGSEVDLHPIRGKRAKAENYAGWIFAASSFIAEEMRALDWTMWRRTSVNKDQWQRDDNHAFNRFLRRPNASETWGVLLERSVVSFNTAGEFFWRLLRDNRKIIGMELLLPHWVGEPVIEDGLHTGWRVNVPGRPPAVFPAEDVIRVFRPHPLNPWLAASVVEAAAVSHNFDMYLRAYGMTVFRNDSGVPAGLLSTEQTLTKDQTDAIREGWRQRYARSRGEVAVLGAGSKYQQISVDLGDLKFLDIGKFTKEQVLELFRVPASLLGADAAGVNRATIEGHLFSFQRHTLRPLASRIGDTIRDWLMPIVIGPSSEQWWWEFDRVVSQDRAAILNEAKESLNAGAITINEYRQKLDLEPVEDGDVYLIPNKATIKETLKPNPPPETAPAPPPPDDDQDDDARTALLLAAAGRRAALAEARAAALERDVEHRKAATALRALFSRWWKHRAGETITMTGLEEHNLTTHDLPDQGELGMREWIEALKDAAPELAPLSVARRTP